MGPFNALSWSARIGAALFVLLLLLLASCGSDGSDSKSAPKCYVDMGECTCGAGASADGTAVDACEQGSDFTTAPIACCDGPDACRCTSWKCEMVGSSCGCEYNGAPDSGYDMCTGATCCKRTNDSRGSCYCGANPCGTGEEQVTQCAPGMTSPTCDFDETMTSSCVPR